MQTAKSNVEKILKIDQRNFCATFQNTSEGNEKVVNRLPKQAEKFESDKCSSSFPQDGKIFEGLD